MKNRITFTAYAAAIVTTAAVTLATMAATTIAGLMLLMAVSAEAAADPDPAPIQVGMDADHVYVEVVHATLHVAPEAQNIADRIREDAGLWVAACRDTDGTIVPTDACLDEAERLWIMTH